MRFSIKSLMLLALIVAVVVWAFTPTVYDLWTIHQYRTQTDAITMFDSDGRVIWTNYVSKVGVDYE